MQSWKFVIGLPRIPFILKENKKIASSIIILSYER